MTMTKLHLPALCALLAGLSLALGAFAQQSASNQVGEMTLQAEDADDIFKPRGYSPYAGRNFPTEVYWGDTHVHTNQSLDARAFGVLLDPEVAFRFARGDEVTATHGQRMKLSRPLDWLVIADHSDGMGAMTEIVAGNPQLLADETVRDWHNRINEGGRTALDATMDVINSFALGNIPKILPAQPVNATPVLSRSARTRQPQSRQVVSGSGVQPRNSL